MQALLYDVKHGTTQRNGWPIFCKNGEINQQYLSPLEDASSGCRALFYVKIFRFFPLLFEVTKLWKFKIDWSTLFSFHSGRKSWLAQWMWVGIRMSMGFGRDSRLASFFHFYEIADHGKWWLARIIPAQPSFFPLNFFNKLHLHQMPRKTLLSLVTPSFRRTKTNRKGLKDPNLISITSKYSRIPQ